MNRTLHDSNNAQKILKLTADTMLLVDKEGVCIDVDPHCDLWFLQEDVLLGKNILALLPEYTRERVTPVFQEVLQEKRRISKNFKLVLKEETYYFKCIMHPYDDMVLCQYRDITQRSNVKRQLEQANRTLREIQKVAQIGQWTYNTNEKLFHYLGYTGVLCEEAVQTISFDKYLEYIVEEDRQAFMEWHHRNEETFNTESISYRIRVGEEIFYTRIQTYMREQRPDGSFNIEGYIQNITDIQHRRNDINTLTHAINNVKESIFAAKADGSLIFANRRFLYNHGFSEGTDISKLKIYDIAADMPSPEAWNERCKDVALGGSSNFIAHHPSRINKEILAFEGTIYNVTDDSGEVSFWSFAHDISERIHYEAKIKRLNQIMDTTINNLPAGIVVKEINNDFRYIYRNRESYNRDVCMGDSIGKNDFDYYPTAIAEIKRKEDIQVATTGKGLHWTTEGRDKNGNAIILDKRKIRVDGDELSSPFIVSIEWDITELEMIKREIQSSKEKAEISNKMKSAFLANMSHEIRTPLNAILGFSHLIADSDSAEDRKKYYDIVEANNERLLELINEILDLSKIESGTVEFTFGPTNLHNLCKEVHDAHIFRTQQGVQLIYEPSDESLMTMTDKNRVFQVFSNLIGNACKFTKEGSISYGYKLVDDRIVIHVTDTGTGIEPEKVGRVFERFAKLNSHAQGTGLGLSICKSIVERLGGNIYVNSELGKGTTFTFTLPYQLSEPSPTQESATDCDGDSNSSAASGSNPNSTEDSDSMTFPESMAFSESMTSSDSMAFSGSMAPSPSESSKAVSSSSADQDLQSRVCEQKPCILVAEDTESNYQLLMTALGKRYRVIRAHDGMQAVMMYDEAKPDLILMDIKLPNLDGLEATKIIRELSPTVPIIIQSAFAFTEDQEAALEAGCNDFVTKPIVMHNLMEILDKWLPTK